MSSGGTQQSLRKYLGAIKDSTTVGLAKVNSDYKELDIAIVRATNHVERPSKEKHIKAIFFAISASRPRADVAYCIHALARRLSKTHNWAVALKTLIVIHRALKEVDPSFREELISYGRTRSHMLNLSHFKDDSSAYAWDFSAWVRTYALYLEERLECFCVMKYDVQIDPVKTRDLNTVELLVQLPALQQLLIRLLNCQPQGAALYNLVIRLAISIVVDESTKIYNAISEGTINLVDKFFEMQRNDAIKALEIYRRSYQQSEMLSEFYEVCKSFGIRHGEEFIKIEQPPASFLSAMEEYVREAPRTSTLRKDQVKEEKTEPKAVLAIEENKTQEEQQAVSPPPPPPEPAKVEEATIMPKETDLLGMHNESPDAAELDNKNALALAIVPVDNPSTTTTAGGLASDGIAGWELALVTVPSSNEAAAASTKLAGGMDMLTLDSLYDDALRRANQPTSYNPWESASSAPNIMMQQPMYTHDPFFASNSISAPYNVQMAAMAQQQQAFMQQQQMMMMMSQQQQLHQPGLNPFGSTYAHVNTHPYGLAVPVHSSNSYAGFT
ncbi:putative clathrin assembly protein At5g35200 [Dendrobium catenatum]|uniref:Clathrin assembly protein n=1 Tax=Dendrobium catenatum TaxID=906689 RepID=A0A2I0X2U1_9ASPA|nr:putative clathrin assembly protein At5g35200 [Dendrobium catenatum]XP_028549727.1 putative clathrin assembly protein At5g35200 [Dendrobium catenatum]PKU82211.1 Putative clathrin assembly protein [Dendrobium catenatum]